MKHTRIAQKTFSISKQDLDIFYSGDSFKIIDFIINLIEEVTFETGKISTSILFTNIFINGCYFICAENNVRIQIEPYRDWLSRFNQQLQKYCETIYTEPLCADISAPNGGPTTEIKIHNIFTTINNKVLVKTYSKIYIDPNANSFRYYDEFGLALETKNLEQFFKDLTKMHPGIEVPKFEFKIT